MLNKKLPANRLTLLLRLRLWEALMLSMFLKRGLMMLFVSFVPFVALSSVFYTVLTAHDGEKSFSFMVDAGGVTTSNHST